MTTTTIPFTPTPQGPFQFQAVLANASATTTYNCSVVWNTWGQRWNLLIGDQNNTLVLAQPLVASPPGYDVSLARGMWTSRFVYLEATQTFLVAT
jgi:hypothetical protein